MKIPVSYRSVALAAGGLAMLLFLSGCRSPSAAPKPSFSRYRYEVVPKGIAGNAVLVDLIGIPPSQLSDWQSCKVSEYFPNSSRRQSADRFEADMAPGKPVVLERKDAVQTKWDNRHAAYLVIMASLNGDFKDGPDDPRRKILRLKKGIWETKATQGNLQIQVLDDGIQITTPDNGWGVVKPNEAR
jgi:hypothetical protein